MVINIPQRRELRCAWCAGVAALALVGCGGGGSSSAPTPPSPTVQAADDSFSLPAGAAADLAVLNNDTVSGATASLTVTTNPAHGKVTVQGSTLRYTPDAGYYGADQLSYRVDAGSASGSATVKLQLSAELTLKGTLSPAPQTTAEVVAQVGGQSFKGSADATGAYSVRVQSASPDDLVTLSSREPGSRSAFALGGLAGSFDTLFKAAVAAQVDAKAVPALALALDVFSTARRGVLQQHGAVPASGASLATALARLNPRDVYESATLLQHVIDASLALPDTAPDLSALAANPTVSAALLAQWSPFDQGVPTALETFLLKATVATPLTPGSTGLRLALHDGTLYTSSADAQHAVIDLRPDGTATVYLNASRAATLLPQAARWRVNGDVLTVTLDSMAFVGLSPNMAVAVWDVALTALEIRQVRSASGQGRPTLAVRRQLSMQQKRIAGGNGSRSPIQDNWTPVTAFIVEQDRLPLKAEDFAAGMRWAGLDLDEDPAKANCLCTPRTVGFTGRLDALGYQGQLNAQGQWVLTSGATTYRHTRLWQGDEGLEYWLVEVEQGGSLVNARVLPVARVPEAATLAADRVARRWQLVTQPERVSPTGDDRQQWLLTADGKGSYSTRLYAYSSTANLTWTRAGDGRSLDISGLPLDIVGSTRDGVLAVMKPYAGSNRGWYGMVPGLIKLQDRGAAP